MHLVPWAERCLLGRSQDAEVAVGELRELPPGDTAGLAQGLRASASDHRVGGRRGGRTVLTGAALGLSCASGLMGWGAGSVGSWGCPGAGNRKSPLREEALVATGPRCSRRPSAGGSTWSSTGGTRPPQPGRCRPPPSAVAPEPHRLLRPQDACLRPVAGQDESHVLGQCHQVSGVAWDRWGGLAWETAPSLGPRWGPTGPWALGRGGGPGWGELSHHTPCQGWP